MSDPSIREFITHPDYQQVAAFFLGAVFITSLNYSSQWIKSSFCQLKRWMSRKRSTPKDVENNIEKASIAPSVNSVQTAEYQNLVFTMSLCFAFASVAFFGSLLSFSPDGGAACAFLVAWGGMAAQTARVIAILILLLELKALGIAKIEFYGSLICLLIEMVLVFVNNALGTGTLRIFKPLDIAVCYRNHFLPTALTTSLIFIFLDVYVLLRFAIVLTRQVTLASQQTYALRDLRITKVLSLLFLELLTIGPSAVHITLLADFVPFSIGSLLVLWVFNISRLNRNARPMRDPSKAPSPISAPARNIATQSVWFSSASGSSQSRPAVVEEETPASPPISPTNFIHPFSAQYQEETSQFSTTTIMTSSQPGTIRVAQRVILTAPTETQSTPQVHSPIPSDVLSVASGGGRTSVEIQVLTPELSPSVSPTSLLMHPWHEKRRRNSTDGSNRSSAASMVRGGQLSYTYQGFIFPVPPVPSPSAAMRRYTSSTLASPMFSQEGGEGNEGGGKVTLLTFQSAFR